MAPRSSIGQYASASVIRSNGSSSAGCSPLALAFARAAVWVLLAA
jgi:hypothetical protein